MQSPPGAETVIDGRRYLYFAGTAYLGLQGRADVIHAACEATRRYGVGSATNRAWFGTTPPLLDVERLAAELMGTEEAFYYVSGYVGHHILLAALAEQFQAVWIDERAHYSAQEAVRLSGRPAYAFQHRDPADLAARLKADLRPGQRPLVVSDGVFPVLGAIAPLAEYARVLREYPGAALSIDDAHGLGVLGPNGRGTLEHTGLIARGFNGGGDEAAASSDGPTLWLCGTLSKALGGFGGVIPGSRAFVERLKAASHYYDAASAVPVPAAAATARAIELVLAEPALRTRLWENALVVKRGLGGLGLATDDTPVPIVCLTIGSAENMQRIQQELMRQGIVIAYAGRYAGVGPAGALRLAVFSTHTAAMIQRLLDALRALL
jgi:7-keto-8-aminopelargonate synthetase-like enzyme